MELNSAYLAKIHPKSLIFAIFILAMSVLLGLSLEWLFSGPFALDLAIWVRFVPVFVSYMLLVPALAIFAITSSNSARVMGYVFYALGFGLVFLIPPHVAGVQGWLSLPLTLVYFLALLALDHYGRRAVQIFSVFASWMFGSAFAKFFFIFTLAIGFLTYFSAQVSTSAQFKIPPEILDPALTLIVNSVSEQIRSELGTGQFTQEEFLAQLKETGLLNFLESQYGITLEESKLVSPEDLVETIREPLAASLTSDMEEFLGDFIGPYLPLLPLIAAVGAALSLLFLSPVFGGLAILAFALMYRFLIWVKFAELAEEPRQVPVLKLR